MAFLDIALPVPAGNGSGTKTDATGFGATKTVTVVGGRGCSVTIETSNDTSGLKWAPLATFTNPGEATFQVACKWMRATIGNYKGIQPVVTVGGENLGTVIAALNVPAGNGIGTSVDTSALGVYKTVQVGGPFRGAVVVEVSEDGGATFSQAMVFTNGGAQSQVIAADFMRVSRNGVPGVDPGSPIVNVAGTSLAGGGGSSGINVEDEGIALPGNPYTTMNFVGAGVAATDVGGVATVTIPGGGGFNPVTTVLYFDDFVNAQSAVNLSANLLAPSLTVTGDGSGVTNVDAGDHDSMGILEFTVSDSGEGAATATFSPSAGVRPIRFGSPSMEPVTVEWRVLPDGTPGALAAEFKIAAGMSSLLDDPINTGGSSGLLFVCSFSAFGNGNWWWTTGHAPFSAGNCTDSGVSVTADWTRLTVIAVDGRNQQFYIDGVLVGSATADLEGVHVGPVLELAINAGGTAHLLDADYLLISQPLDRT